MIKKPVLAIVVLVMALGIYLQLQIDEINDRLLAQTPIRDVSLRAERVFTEKGGGPFIVADPDPDMGQARDRFRGSIMKMQSARNSDVSLSGQVGAFEDADAPRIESTPSEAQYIGPFLSVDDPRIYEVLDSEPRYLGAFIDADSQYR